MLKSANAFFPGNDLDRIQSHLQQHIPLNVPFIGDMNRLESMKWEARPDAKGNKPNKIAAVLIRIHKFFVKIANGTGE
jgi:hypothetical protein